MIEFLYELLNQVGFTHPLHPAITHLPMGMAMGAFFFSLGSLKYAELARTAYHCAILGLIFVLPTMFLGILEKATGPHLRTVGEPAVRLEVGAYIDP